MLRNVKALAPRPEGPWHPLKRVQGGLELVEQWKREGSRAKNKKLNTRGSGSLWLLQGLNEETLTSMPQGAVRKNLLRFAEAGFLKDVRWILKTFPKRQNWDMEFVAQTMRIVINVSRKHSSELAPEILQFYGEYKDQFGMNTYAVGNLLAMGTLRDMRTSDPDFLKTVWKELDEFATDQDRTEALWMYFEARLRQPGGPDELLDLIPKYRDWSPMAVNTVLTWGFLQNSPRTALKMYTLMRAQGGTGDMVTFSKLISCYHCYRKHKVVLRLTQLCQRREIKLSSKAMAESILSMRELGREDLVESMLDTLKLRALGGKGNGQDRAAHSQVIDLLNNLGKFESALHYVDPHRARKGRRKPVRFNRANVESLMKSFAGLGRLQRMFSLMNQVGRSEYVDLRESLMTSLVKSSAILDEAAAFQESDNIGESSHM